MTLQGFIGLGSNLGDRVTVILQAVEAIDDTPGVSVRRLSTLLETSPVGDHEQPDFLNAVAEVRSNLSAVEMMDILLSIEHQLGRDRTDGIQGGPRTIDLDLLIWGDVVQESPGLRLPHPRLPDRAFVLVPMVELAPEFVHPTLGKVMRDLLAEEIKHNGDLAGRCRPAGPGPLITPDLT
ncbi:MAG: 2-amino-4-hydroxy-6-hydroxymethyldihydropteridine diphosphokinase [Planctomycetota bacterium]|nr:2-amino-4-hydroxy-6-hydroxymethyldihydropteridine diphosphokinase [Planctomycetota bacterium]